jgi:hypothetical protein
LEIKKPTTDGTPTVLQMAKQGKKKISRENSTDRIILSVFSTVITDEYPSVIVAWR